MTDFQGLFKNYSSGNAIVWKNEAYTYGFILNRINYWRNKLEAITSDNVVGLESDFSPETIAILFILIEKNNIIVPLDITHSNKNEKKITIAQLDVLIKVKSETEIEIIYLVNNETKNDLYNIIKWIYILY